jgi:uncharacterized protein (DUF1499 family)
VELHPKAAAIAQCLPHRLWTVMKIDNYLVATVASKILSNVTDEWFPKYRNGGFGAVRS